mgnify:CR=1 FL=1
MLYFKLSELIHSDTAVKYNINNMPTVAHLDCMLDLIYYVLQPIREHFGVPVDITGGYRSWALWEKLRKLGRNPAKNSQHLCGQAVDFTVRGKNTKEVFNWIKSSKIEFDQLIYEYDSTGNVWIHISFVKGKNRRQVIDNYKGC